MIALKPKPWRRYFSARDQLIHWLLRSAFLCILIVLNVPSALAGDSPAAPRNKNWSAATRSKSQTSAIQLIAADTADEGESSPAAVPSAPVQTDPSHDASLSGTDDHTANPLAPESSLTDQLKKALQHERESRGLSPTPLLPAPVLSPAVPTADAMPEVSPALQSDLYSADPRKREKAQRLLKLKQQLLFFRSHIHAGTAKVATEHRADDASGGGSTEPAISPTTEPTATPSELAASDETHNDETSSDDAAGEHLIHEPSQPDHAANLPKNVPGRQQRPSPQRTTVKSSGIDHAVVDGPIDRLGLANNLYAVGDYLLALEMYEQADSVTMTSQQQIWTEYQIANCLRRTGRTAEASNRYRRIAEQPEAGWLSHQSRWWVDVLTQMQIIQKGLDQKLETESTHGQLPR